MRVDDSEIKRRKVGNEALQSQEIKEKSIHKSFIFSSPSKPNGTVWFYIISFLILVIIVTATDYTDSPPNNGNKITTNIINNLSKLVTQEEYGAAWPYTIPQGTLNCETRDIAGYNKQDVTITYASKTYAINGSARSSNNYLPLEEIWRDSPEYPGSKISDPGIIKRGLSFCQ